MLILRMHVFVFEWIGTIVKTFPYNICSYGGAYEKNEQELACENLWEARVRYKRDTREDWYSRVAK